MDGKIFPVSLEYRFLNQRLAPHKKSIIFMVRGEHSLTQSLPVAEDHHHHYAPTHPPQCVRCVCESACGSRRVS